MCLGWAAHDDDADDAGMVITTCNRTKSLNKAVKCIATSVTMSVVLQ